MASSLASLLTKQRSAAALLIRLYSRPLDRLASSTNYASSFAKDDFVPRHIGPSAADMESMLDSLGFKSLSELVEKIIPDDVKSGHELRIADGIEEREMLAELKEKMSQNEVWKSYIGLGYHDCVVPAVILRNVFENPGWYTQYTPYQPEISQGRLESLLNYQTMVSDLTGLGTSNASLLDEATACAEAMALAARVTKRKVFYCDAKVHPQNLELVLTRARPLVITIEVMPYEQMDFSGKNVAGVLVQYPDTEGFMDNYAPLFKRAKEHGTIAICAADPLACVLFRPPGEFGADVAVGTTQRLGIPLNYGGPHAAYFAVDTNAAKGALVRMMPGRVIGLTKWVLVLFCFDDFRFFFRRGGFGLCFCGPLNIFPPWSCTKRAKASFVNETKIQIISLGGQISMCVRNVCHAPLCVIDRFSITA